MNTLEDLKQTLISRPNIKKVYFNENGEWLTYPRKNYPNEKTREEVLGEEALEVSKTAKEVIAEINAATTAEEVAAIIGDDKRKSVTDAAEKMIAKLTK